MPRRPAGGDPDRHRQRSSLCVEAYEKLQGRGHRRARRRQHAVLGAVREAGSSLPRRGAAAERHGARLGRAGLGDRLGPLCRPRARSSACTRSAPRRRSRSCSRSSASRPRRSCEAARKVADRTGRNVMNPLKHLQKHGQAVWLDFLAREFVAEGELKTADRAATALTRRDLQPIDLREGDRRAATNTTRRSASCSGTRDMAVGDLRAPRDRGHPARRRRAAPGLRRDERRRRLRQPRSVAVSRQRHRGDIAEARRLWKAVGRENLMVKVPATAGRPAGDPRADRRGHQHQRHAAVLAAMSTRRSPRPISPGSKIWSEGRRPAQVASVASFFVSRIDTAVDKQSTRRSRPRMTPTRRRGSRHCKARSRSPTRSWPTRATRRLFSGARWEKLAAKGAQTQRLLWASTGTKNKAYSDFSMSRS